MGEKSMKQYERCGYDQEITFHQVEGYALCENCYTAWVSIQRDIFIKFLGMKLRIEKEVQYAI